MSGQPKVGYVVSRFPKTTETFIVREACAVADAGVPVELFAINRERTELQQPRAAELSSRLSAISDLGPTEVLRSQARSARQSPSRLGRVWARGIFGNISSPKFLSRAVVTSLGAPALADAALQRGVTHLHAHWGTHSALLAYQMHLLTDLPFSVMLHAHDLHVDQTMLAEKLAAASAVCTISEHNRALLIDSYPGVEAKVHIVRCGVDTRDLAVRTEPPTNPIPRVVVVAGLREFKGHRYLLEAQRLLATRNRPIALDLVGDGPLAEELRADAATSDAEVAFHGALTFDKVQRIVLGADAAVLPSVVLENGRRDGIPTALIEAMACGVPVIGTRVSGVPELVEHGVTGRLVEQRDPGGLADALVALIDDRAETEAMARAARQRVEAEYDIDQIASRLISALGLVSTRSADPRVGALNQSTMMNTSNPVGDR